MKRLLTTRRPWVAALGAVAMVLTATACGDEPDADSAALATDAPAAAAEPASTEPAAPAPTDPVAGATDPAPEATTAGTDAPDVDLTGVTLVLGSNDPGLQAGFEGSGILDDLPYDVEFVLFGNQVETSTALITGDIDGSVLAQYTVIQAAAAANPAWTAETIPYKTVLVTRFGDPGKYDPFGTVASSGSGITELTADAVRGKKWTASPGATNYLTMLQTLDHLGLGLADIEYVQLNNAEGALALLNNQVDLASGGYSSYFQTLENGGTKLPSGTQVGPGSPGALVATSASLEDPAKAAAWEDLIQRFIEYYLWRIENPEEAQAVLVEVNKISPEQAEQSWLYGRSAIGTIDEDSIAAAQEIVDLALAHGAISTSVDASIEYDDRFHDLIEQTLVDLDFQAALDESIAAYG